MLHENVHGGVIIRVFIRLFEFLNYGVHFGPLGNFFSLLVLLLALLVIFFILLELPENIKRGLVLAVDRVPDSIVLLPKLLIIIIRPWSSSGRIVYRESAGRPLWP